MINYIAPERLWDVCLGIELSAHGMTVMSGETSDKSQFCEFELFEWVMFQDKMTPYLDEHFKHRYLGPRIDVGPAMMAKIFKENDIGPHTKH